MRIDADAGSGGQIELKDAADGRPKIMRGVFGIDAAFDSASPRARRIGDVIARRDTQLIGDQVTAETQFGDRMFDLEARVDFEEVEVVAVNQEFGGTSVSIAGRAREFSAASTIRSRIAVDRPGAGDSSIIF